jgi:hypothetical protein
MPATEKFRLPLDFTAEGLAEIERLRTLSGANTRAETIRYAVRILDWVTEQMGAGNRIAVERDGKWQEVIFPFLPKPKATPPREVQVTVAQVDEEVLDRERDMVARAVKAGKQAYRDISGQMEKS